MPSEAWRRIVLNIIVTFITIPYLQTTTAGIKQVAEWMCMMQMNFNKYIYICIYIRMCVHIGTRMDLLICTYRRLCRRVRVCHFSLLWRHNGRDSVSNHQPHDCLLNRLIRRRSKKTSKLRVTGLCAGNSPGTGEFPAQMASNAENVSIWWRHHDLTF